MFLSHLFSGIYTLFSRQDGRRVFCRNYNAGNVPKNVLKNVPKKGTPGSVPD
jgi:hypothetical protein